MDAELRPGDAIPELAVTPDRHSPVRYAGASGDFNPIHIDDEFARAVGLPGRILHGLWTMAQVARAGTAITGDPQSLARLAVQFRGMGIPEHEIVVRGTVREIRDGVVTVEATAEQDGNAIVPEAVLDLRVG